MSCFCGYVAAVMYGKLGIGDPEKWNHENSVCLLYSENFIPLKFLRGNSAS